MGSKLTAASVIIVFPDLVRHMPPCTFLDVSFCERSLALFSWALAPAVDSEPSAASSCL